MSSRTGGSGREGVVSVTSCWAVVTCAREYDWTNERNHVSDTDVSHAMLEI